MPQHTPTEGYPHEQFPPSQQAESKPPKLLALLSLIVGIIGLLALLFPWVAIGAGVVAVVLGVIALIRKHSKGLAISGTILGGVAILFGIGVFVLLTVADAQLQQLGQTQTPGIEETEEPQAPSEFDALRAELGHDDFAEIDAETFAAIVADPESYQEEPIVVYGSMGQPLVHPGLEEQGMCLTQLEAHDTPDGVAGEGTGAIVVDEIIDNECPFTDRMLGIGGEGVSAEALAAMHKLYVLPGQPVQTEADGDLPGFVLVYAEDVDAP